MRSLRFGIAPFAASLLLSGVASAGPINWGYSSTGNREGSYWFSGSSAPLGSAPGEVRNIPVYSLIGSYSAPSLISPIPLSGPTLMSRVTVLDSDSGQSGSFDVPITFFDNEPAPEGEQDMHIPGLGGIAAQRLTLGRNQYSVSGDPENLYVTVDSIATPEPSTILLAGAGLTAAAGLRRRRAKPLNP